MPTLHLLGATLIGAGTPVCRRTGRSASRQQMSVCLLREGVALYRSMPADVSAHPAGAAVTIRGEHVVHLLTEEIQPQITVCDSPQMPLLLPDG
jgi:hypothetical protein